MSAHIFEENTSAMPNNIEKREKDLPLITKFLNDRNSDYGAD